MLSASHSRLNERDLRAIEEGLLCLSLKEALDRSMRVIAFAFFSADDLSFFVHMNPNGRGIHRGVGICSCNDELQCTCLGQQGNDVPGDKEERPRKSRDRKNEIISGARKGWSRRNA